MSIPEQESDRERNIRFGNAIRDKFKCRATFRDAKCCDLSPFAKGVAFTFDLTSQPEKYPDAKRCFVWDSKNFKPGEVNSEVVVLDVQVTSDPDELPFDAVWAWLTDSLVKNTDIYVKSEKWSKGQLHGEQVEFRILPGERKLGRFFVRERVDGMIAVRVVEEGECRLNGRREKIDVSFCLTPSQVERIESPFSNTSYFRLTLP